MPNEPATPEPHAFTIDVRIFDSGVAAVVRRDGRDDADHHVTDNLPAMWDDLRPYFTGEEEPVPGPTDVPPAWVLVWHRDGGDYYAGEDAAIYRDGEIVWNGTSCGSVAGILAAIVGEYEVREVSELGLNADADGSDFPPRLADLDADAG